MDASRLERAAKEFVAWLNGACRCPCCEGVIEGRGPRGEYLRNGTVYESARTLWAAGWDRLNGKRGFAWASNPWVWVVTFKRVECA